MPNLAPIDWLIVLLYLFCVIAIGFSVRSSIKTTKDFLQAGRALPTWICAAGFIAASMGSQEVIAMGAAGARFGFEAALLFSLGAIPAILLAGVYMMPLYYGSGARTTPEYLSLRFDEKTRLLNACMFVVVTVASAGISLYLMARLLEALRIFDPLFYGYGWPHQGIFTFCILLVAIFVLVYVLIGGLAGAMVNQALQFLVMVAGFLPMVLTGLKNVGGWSGLKASIPGSYLHSVYGLGVIPSILLWCLFGFVLGAGHWSTDFRLLQTAMAAKNINSARRIPLFGAAFRLVLPFLLILPGAIAVSLPTPQSTTVVRDVDGTIYHEITVVPPEAAEGSGMIPARLNAATGKPQLSIAGQVLLNYDMATPTMVMHFLPTGLLGLGVAALLASLMSGLAASVTALNAVFTFDIYESFVRKDADKRNSLAVGRVAAACAIALSIGVAYAIAGLKGIGLESVFASVLLVFSLGNAPQFATFLLGMFTKRATGHGAFAGLVAGIVGALLHHGLTLPMDAQPGLQGGWIAVLHRYPGFVAQCLLTAMVGLAANAMVASAVSLCTKARPEKELKRVVHSLTRRRITGAWWKRPEALAMGILLAALVLSAFFV